MGVTNYFYILITSFYCLLCFKSPTSHIKHRGRPRAHTHTDIHAYNNQENKTKKGQSVRSRWACCPPDTLLMSSGDALIFIVKLLGAQSKMLPPGKLTLFRCVLHTASLTCHAFQLSWRCRSVWQLNNIRWLPSVGISYFPEFILEKKVSTAKY